MEQLVNVDRSMSIGTTNSSEDGEWLLYEFDPKLHSSPIAITFPSLVNATYIELWGNITRSVDFSIHERHVDFSLRIYMPNLATSVEPANPNPQLEYFQTGITIQNFGNPVTISFLSLWNTTSITIAGGLEK
jgi:hypothetical protein